MGQLTSRWQRPGLETSSGDHERRINILERQANADSCCDSGFSTYRACVLANPHLLAYFPMSDASGNLADLTGGADAQRITDVSSITYGVDGPFDLEHPDWTAINFTGIYGPTGPEDRFRRLDTLPAQWTVEAWIYPIAPNSGVESTIFHHSSGSLGMAFNVGGGGHDNRLSAFRSGVGLEAPSALTLSTWTHARVTYDGATIRLYTNGALVASVASVGAFTGSSYWTIGNNDPDLTAGSVRPFNGRISDVAVYDAALTDFCDTVTPTGPGTGSADEGTVLTADGEGGTSYAFPTVAVEGTRYRELLAGTHLAAVDNLDETVTINSAGVEGDTVWNVKGDLAVASGTDAATRLPVGTDGQVLVADSGETLGVKWEDASVSPADDTLVWMPLTTTVGGDDVLVFDADHSLIPTLIPF